MGEGKRDDVALQDVPPAQRHIIERPRLYRLLDEADARIILLVAPAGYGKTTLARQWTALRGRRAFWYRAGAASLDPAALAQAIAEAIAPEFPDAPRRLREYLLGASSPDQTPRVLAEVLAENATPWPATSWLVIDDYQAFLGAEASEMVVERFAELSRAKVLITSREHPRWISARRVLYGEALEVGVENLAMRAEEANAVLAQAGEGSSTLVEAAEGWPAVIGLAAMLPLATNISEATPGALYDFIAQELFQMLDVSTQRDLPLLALPNSLDTSILRLLFGDVSVRVRDEAVRVGLASLREGSRLEIHPLVRKFLLRKLDEDPPPELLLDKLVTHLINASEWDDAFAVIERHELDAHLERLVETALVGVLTSGRMATLERWIERGRTRQLEVPVLALARAEVLLRRGDWVAARAIAEACVPLLSVIALAAEAHLCAGTAAQLSDDIVGAQFHFAEALTIAPSLRVAQRAVWGQLLSSVMLPKDQREGPLRALEAIRDATPGHLLRLNQAKLIWATRDGWVADAADAAAQAMPLVDEETDPMVRSGFLNSLADALTMSARYEEGERAARAELADAKRSRLNFVAPSALLNIAGALLGKGDYTGAAAVIDEVERLGAPPDSFLRANIIGLRARIAVSDATTSTFDVETHDLDESRADVRGETFALFALWLASVGDLRGAASFLRRAKKESLYATTRTSISIAALIIAIGGGGNTPRRAREMIETVSTTQVYDAIVCGSRADGRLLDAVLAEPDGSLLLATVARRSLDSTICAVTGITLARHRNSPLSARELDVLKLTAQGMRNVDIAARLFISPKTVKTHLRNIYEKLDVRSRTQAVVKAKSAGMIE